LFVSIDDGKTWQEPLKKVTGDAGAKIASGNHSITWDVLEEFEELRGDKIKFQVRADDHETVKIGTQEWTIKNLDVSTYKNGDIIPEVKDYNEWIKLKTGAWCYYDNDPENGKIYGKLYNWYAVNDPRGLAPEGFHIPSDKEWTILINYLGGDDIAGGKMKEQGTEHWNTPNATATNSSGFSGLPGGYRNSLGPFFDIRDYCMLWTRTTISGPRYASFAWRCRLWKDYAFADQFYYEKEHGMSVRCIKDSKLVNKKNTK
jgi:uncharacterized protein (TIGR02145 family)